MEALSGAAFFSLIPLSRAAAALTSPGRLFSRKGQPSAIGLRFFQKSRRKFPPDFVCFDVDKRPSGVIHCKHQLNIIKALMEKSTVEDPGQ